MTDALPALSFSSTIEIGRGQKTGAIELDHLVGSVNRPPKPLARLVSTHQRKNTMLAQDEGNARNTHVG